MAITIIGLEFLFRDGSHIVTASGDQTARVFSTHFAETR